MKERPILFNTEMVQAVLAGRKTQTRRVVKPQPQGHHWEIFDEYKHHLNLIECQGGQFLLSQHSLRGRVDSSRESIQRILSPYGKPGDLLWVRETWGEDDEGNYAYKASDYPWDYLEGWKWKPSIFMPKAASRIWLRVTDVRVERVQDISTQDIKAEGVTISMRDFKPLIPLNDKHFPHEYLSEFITNDRQFGEDELFRACWIRLWDSINADRGYSWESNPWVWVVSFDVISTEGKP